MKTRDMMCLTVGTPTVLFIHGAPPIYIPNDYHIFILQQLPGAQTAVQTLWHRGWLTKESQSITAEESNTGLQELNKRSEILLLPGRYSKEVSICQILEGACGHDQIETIANVIIGFGSTLHCQLTCQMFVLNFISKRFVSFKFMINMLDIKIVLLAVYHQSVHGLKFRNCRVVRG